MEKFLITTQMFLRLWYFEYHIHDFAIIILTPILFIIYLIKNNLPSFLETLILS